jgi:hypothetical protein
VGIDKIRLSILEIKHHYLNLTMSSFKARDFPLLFEVLREGLVLGLVSRAEIIAWADSIIASEEDPDYFLIELSLCGDINSICEVLDKHIKRVRDPICDRVLLGLIYHERLTDDLEEIEETAILVGRLAAWNVLSRLENNRIYEFQDYTIYYYPDLTHLLVSLNAFLSLYKSFTLDNYEQWTDINHQVLEELKKEQAKDDMVIESYRKAYEKKQKKRKLTLLFKRVAVVIAILGIIAILIWDQVQNNAPPFSLYFFSIYMVARWGYRWWRERLKLKR